MQRLALAFTGRRQTRSRAATVLIVIGAGLMAAPPARAGTFAVNSSADEADLLLDGTCDADPAAGAEACTLRAAVQEANDTAAADTILLPALDDPYELSLSGLGEDEAAGGDLDIIRPLTLQGSGQPLIDGLGADRLLHVGPSGAPAVTVSGVELRGGGSVSTGAGIMVEDGTLSLQSSTVAGNTAEGAGGTAEGGGVWIGSLGTHLVGSTTISGNVAEGDTGALGGGLAIDVFGASATLTNVTVSGNAATATGGVAQGGGIASGGTLGLSHATVHQNSAAGTSALGGSIASFAGSVSLRASIISAGVADSGSQNCSELLGTGFLSGGSNLEAPAEASDSECGLSSGQGDHFSGSAELAPLADRGGPTLTHALLTTSPALDGVPSCSLVFDQRGEARPSGSACDGGAFERQVRPAPGTGCFGMQPTIIGTSEDERLIGTPGADVIIGQAGNDLIKGRGGADRICAGKGPDRVYGGGAGDRIAGEDGKDRLFGQAGADLLLGNAARDLLSGGKGLDSLNGGGSRDRCKGGGRDRLKRCR